MRLTSSSARAGGRVIPGAGLRTGSRTVSQVITLPPPVGGWNQRDALSAMEATDAITLDNWIPQRGGVQLRKGYGQWATGLSGTYVESLMPYAAPGSGSKLFAATPTTIYDVTAQGAVGSAIASSLANGRWSHTMFATSAGNFLYMCNGADAPRYYDGSAWTNSAFTGVTLANLDYVTVHMSRLWFIEKNTCNAWYAPTVAIAGALTKFVPPFKLGGTLTALASWTRDGGSGSDDYFVFLSTNGECAIYVGDDPSDATTWAMVGTFKIPEPIGRRCVMKLGSDVGLLTNQGPIPLSTVLGQSTSGAGQSALTNKISGAFSDAYAAGSSLFGWQMIEYPKEAIAIVNVPVTERSIQYQFVINSLTGAWCRFKGINAGCFVLFGSNIYFGGNNSIVYKYGTDYNDDGAGIVAYMQTAYSTLGSPYNKIFRMARPIFIAPSDYVPSVYLRTDYDTSPLTVDIVSSVDPGTAWDTGYWDTSEWGEAAVPSLPWQGVNGIGIAGSVAFGISAQSVVTFNGVDVMFELGGPL